MYRESYLCTLHGKDNVLDIMKSNPKDMYAKYTAVDMTYRIKA